MSVCIGFGFGYVNFTTDVHISYYILLHFQVLLFRTKCTFNTRSEIKIIGVFFFTYLHLQMTWWDGSSLNCSDATFRNDRNAFGQNWFPLYTAGTSNTEMMTHRAQKCWNHGKNTNNGRDNQPGLLKAKGHTNQWGFFQTPLCHFFIPESLKPARHLRSGLTHPAICFFFFEIL